MTLTQSIVARLKERVAALSGRVEGAAEFAELVRANRLPMVTPAANVLPLGLQGRPGQSSAGAFTQMVTEGVGVLLTLRTDGQAHDRTDATLDGLIADILAALCGWSPGDQVGVLELARGNLVGLREGTLIYQLDFTLTDQLRIFA